MIVQRKDGKLVKVNTSAAHKKFLKEAPLAVRVAAVLGYALDENIRILLTDLEIYTSSGLFSKQEEHRRIQIIKQYLNKTYGLSLPVSEWNEPEGETHEVKRIE